MRMAAGLILAGAISLWLSGAAWSQTPAAKGAGQPPRQAPAAAAPAARRGRRRRPAQPASAACTNPERARRRPHRRDRHHRRAGLRLRAFQAARLPARQGSGADLRRRPVAGQYARGAEGAGGGMHDRHFLPDRQARDLLSGNPEAGLRGRPHRRLPHLVARQPHQQEADRGAAQGGDRERLQRGEVGAGRHLARAVLPLPGAAASAGNGDLSRQPQHRDVLLRHQLLRLQGRASRRP